MKHPFNRLRRLRKNLSLRDLRAESYLLTCQLIQPIFITDQKHLAKPIETMPGIRRVYIDHLIDYANKLDQWGIRTIALFPVLDPKYKTESGDYAHQADGLIPKAIRLLKNQLPQMAVMLDIALDPYTTHGQDGILDAQGQVDNDQTIDALVKQSLIYADAGAKILAPSDMMDGRIGVIRAALEQKKYKDVVLISYCAKYASSFYTPFRDAVLSSNLLKANKTDYQMDYRNAFEAFFEAQLDIDEGADMLIVKPGLPYLDVICRLKQRYPFMPVLGYHVSAEYSMLKLLSKTMNCNEEDLVLETLTAFIRSGASGVISYYAGFIAKHLNKQIV